MDRPPVSVIVPFHGDEVAGRKTLAALAALALRRGDEVLVADNTPEGVLAALAPREAFATRVKRQPYSARNEAAARATGEWLLFTDADCRPAPDLLDAYFDPPPGPGVGALAGEVVAAGGTGTLAERYARDRRLLSAELFLDHPYRPMGVTANLLVRRDAFDAIGGFHEGIRSGGDADLCWRLQEAGWTIEHRPRAVVAHEHRETLAALLRQAARTAAGTRWLEARHPGFHANAGGPARAARALAGIVTWPLRGQPERGAFKAVELLVITTEYLGRLAGNSRPGPPPRSEGVLVVEEPPGRAGGEETGVGAGEYVEAVRRPLGARAVAPAGTVAYSEDDGLVRRLAAAARVALRHPRAAVRHRRLLLELAPAARRAWAGGVQDVRGDGERARALADLTLSRQERGRSN